MKAIFRTWFAYFGIVWLQEWLGILGAFLIIIAMLIAVLAKMPNAIPAVAGFGFTGAALLAFVPAMMGGGALRYGSSRSMLFLRPNGRLRMIISATLVITTLAALITLPRLVMSLLYLQSGTGPRGHLISPGALFAFCWSGIVVAWICVFVITSNPALGFLTMFLPLTLTTVTRRFTLEMPDPLTALAFGVAAWGAFILWYMKTGKISPPRWYGDRTTQDFESTPLAMCLSWLDWSRGPMQRPRAISQVLLGVSSPIRSGIALAAWVLLFLGFMFLANPHSRSIMFEMPGFPMFMAAMMGGTMAYMTTRRSRMLWLRAGFDRAGLFSSAERNGLVATLLSMTILIAVTAALTLRQRPELGTELLMFSIAQLTVALCVFYGGMALTHGWNAEDLLLCFGLGALFIFQMFFTKPAAGNSLTALAAVITVHALVAALLRFYARRSWLKLDWRVAKLQKPFGSR